MSTIVRITFDCGATVGSHPEIEKRVHFLQILSTFGEMRNYNWIRLGCFLPAIDNTLYGFLHLV